ncbi:hypothetical protein EB093_02685 [bacterium]|nr:hypothetical protein [bacterium]
MAHDLGRVNAPSLTELQSQAPSRRPIDSQLKAQLKDVLMTSRSIANPSRIDVVTAVDKLQNLSTLLNDTRSKGVIDHVINKIQTDHLLTITTAASVEKIIASVISGIQAQTTSVKPATKSHSSEFTKSRHPVEPMHDHDTLSQKALSIIKRLFT